MPFLYAKVAGPMLSRVAYAAKFLPEEVKQAYRMEIWHSKGGEPGYKVYMLFAEDGRLIRDKIVNEGE